MLKRIDTADVEMGMFVHKFEGSWFDHPFWKARFLIDDRETLADVLASDISGVIIDTSKGKDSSRCAVQATARPKAPAPRPPRQERSVPPIRPPQPSSSESSRTRSANMLRSTRPLTMAREFGNAKLVADKSVKVISKVFLESRLGKAVRVRDVQPVVEDIYASVQRNPFAFSGLMRCKQDYECIYLRALSVSALMVSLARQMRFSPQETLDAGTAGLLMDIGISYLPPELIAKEGNCRLLDPAMQIQHVMLGHDRLVAAGDFPDTVLNVCLRHHEMLDGSGYPQQLRGNEIDLCSRMAAICDSFDSMVAVGPGADGLDPAEALERITAQEAKFDRDILRHFIDSVGVYPIGSFVRLRSGRLAMVVEQDPDDSSHPVVLALPTLRQEGGGRAKRIELANCYGEDEIEGIADLAGVGLPNDIAGMREKLLETACRI